MIVVGGLLCVEKHATVIRFDRVHIPLGPPRAVFVGSALVVPFIGCLSWIIVTNHFHCLFTLL